MGHAYCTIAADVIARYKRLRGHKVHFLTGTDEHGQKIEKAAEAAGETPKQLADRVVERYKSLWKTLNISYDDFIRTTEDRHTLVVKQFFKLVYDKGDIYLGEYEGLYCRPCESYYTETQLVDKMCPSCGRAVELLKEESYFFRLSRYQELVAEYIRQNPTWIQPEFRRNEVLGMLKEPMPDLSITRTTSSWGIAVPDLGDDVRNRAGDLVRSKKSHYIYVWFDALLNYITAIDYLSDAGKFLEHWPADLHLVGKDIVKFHCIIWPAMLMSVGMPMPKLIFGHGFILADGEKMSKSKGNALDPQGLIEKYGVDVLRYFLLREISFGNDGSISHEGLIKRLNSELNNDLGNLLHRTLSMLEKYNAGAVPNLDGKDVPDEQLPLKTLALEVIEKVDGLVDQIKLSAALDSIWSLVNRANQLIEESAPWALFKKAELDRLNVIMYQLCETLRLLGLLLAPYMPTVAQSIWEQLGLTTAVAEARKAAWDWGRLKAGTVVKKTQPLFVKYELVAPAVA